MSTQNKFSDNSKSPISPKITHSKLQYHLQNLTIYEVLSKCYHYITNLIYIQFQIIHFILIMQYPKFPCHIYIKRSNHFILKVHITLPSQSKLSSKNTSLEVHNINLAGNTVLNCVKFPYNSNNKNSLKNTSQKILKCQIDISRYNHLNFILILYHLQL